MSNVARLVPFFLSAGLTITLVAPALAIPSAQLAKFTPTKKAKKAAPQKVKGPRFVRMEVAGVVGTDAGPAVVLKDSTGKNLMPIWIGYSEAHAIQLRLAGERFQRPLTHDLLDTVMRKLGGKLLKIHVEDLRNDTFIGRIFIQTDSGVVELDARPSDSIALALGNKAPIFVDRKVLERAKLSPEDREGQTRPKSDPFEPPPEIKTL